MGPSTPPLFPACRHPNAASICWFLRDVVGLVRESGVCNPPSGQVTDAKARTEGEETDSVFT